MIVILGAAISLGGWWLKSRVQTRRRHTRIAMRLIASRLRPRQWIAAWALYDDLIAEEIIIQPKLYQDALDQLVQRGDIKQLDDFITLSKGASDGHGKAIQLRVLSQRR